jgi:hypothetical protein
MPVLACLYLVGGETSRGKTTTCRLISALGESANVPFLHQEIDEPGSTIATPARQLFRDPAKFRALAAGKSGKAQEKQTDASVMAYAFSEYMALFEKWAEDCKGILVLDSIWKFVAFAATVLDVPSPQKGVHPAYASAIEALDALAVRKNCAIFATQNTTLFPIPKLDGASGGEVDPRPDSPIIVMNSRNDRQFKEFRAPMKVWNDVMQMRKEK